MQKWLVAALVAISYTVDAYESSFDTYETCGDFRLDLVLIQDASWSIKDDLPLIKNVLPELLHGIEYNFPGSRFGLTTFTDKPIPPRGTFGDWCYKLVHPLTQDINKLISTFDETSWGYGGDANEGQLDAIKYTFLDDKVGWNTWDEALPYKATLRVFMLVSDFDFNYPSRVETDLETDWVGLYAAQGYTIDPLCVEADYPTLDYVVELVQSYNAVPIFLLEQIADETYYWKLVRAIDDGGTVRRIKNDISDFLEIAISAISEVSCQAILSRTSTTTTTTTVTRTSTLTTTSTSTVTTTTTTTTAAMPVGAVVGASVGLIVLIGALAAGGVFYYNKDSSPDEHDRQLGEPELATHDVLHEERDFHAPVAPTDYA